MKWFFILMVSSLLLGCESEVQEKTASSSDTSDKANDAPNKTKLIDLTVSNAASRWYTAEQVKDGRLLFSQYCAACHGEKAEATKNWKTPTPEGHYPPPPLNGTAHAWHHPFSVLDMVIKDGGEPVGGVMPAWGKILNAEQRKSIIASFQDYWSDEIYQLWLERDPDF